jgi:hypothetical protein
MIVSNPGEHSRLVLIITDWIRNHAEFNAPSLYLLHDTPETLSGSRPPRVGNFVPDVLAGSVPPRFTVIGEAKCSHDLRTSRSTSQVYTFIEYLVNEVNPHLVIATHSTDSAYARGLVRRAMSALKAEHVCTVFLTDW